MPLPQKRWFRIPEVALRWSIPPSDIEDYALDEMLQLAVFVVGLPAEAGTWDEDEEVCQTVPPGFWGGFLHLLGLGSC